MHDVEKLRTAAQLMREEEDCLTGEEPFYAAVADWLGVVADNEPSWGYAHAEREATSALAVARAYLGVTSDA